MADKYERDTLSTVNGLYQFHPGLNGKVVKNTAENVAGTTKKGHHTIQPCDIPFYFRIKHI